VDVDGDWVDEPRRTRVVTIRIRETGPAAGQDADRSPARNRQTEESTP
jgi:hypothetical protein